MTLLSEWRVTFALQSLVTCAVFFCALTVAMVVRRAAASVGLLDEPNERSSHSRPTPRGGGIGIFIAVTMGVWFCSPSFCGGLSIPSILLGGGCVAIVGLWDDVRSVSARVRLLIHLLAGVFVIFAFPNGITIQFLQAFSVGGAAAAVLSCLGVVSLINIFNFMDGIDGLAAAEAVFVAAAAALLIFVNHIQSPVFIVCAIISAASAGFLVVNWSPARIFMGDVGSGFLGFAIASVALWAIVDELMPVWTWFILGGLFITDATITLVRRLFRGDKVTSAHRLHAYQHLARRWSSHRSVTIAAALINCFWLLPLAALSMHRPDWAPAICVLALLPIGITVWMVGAGIPG